MVRLNKLLLTSLITGNFFVNNIYSQQTNGYNSKHNKAILVIDVFAEHKEREIENICKVIKDNPQCPVFIFGYHYNSGIVPEINEKILSAAEPDAIKMFKKNISAFSWTGLKDSLYKRGIDTLLVSGFVWNGCVKYTAEDAIEENFAVISSPKLMYGSEFRGEGAEFYKSKTIFCNSIEKVNKFLR